MGQRNYLYLINETKENFVTTNLNILDNFPTVNIHKIQLQSYVPHTFKKCMCKNVKFAPKQIPYTIYFLIIFSFFEERIVDGYLSIDNGQSSRINYFNNASVPRTR